MGFLDSALLLIGLERRTDSRPRSRQALQAQRPVPPSSATAAHRSEVPSYRFPASPVGQWIAPAPVQIVSHPPRQGSPSHEDLAQQIAVLQIQLSELAQRDAQKTSPKAAQKAAQKATANKAQFFLEQSELVRRTLALRRQERLRNTTSQGHAGG
jgi:hypothetical protein